MAVSPPYLQNTIVLKTHGYHEEDVSDAGANGISPGMLLQKQPDGGVIPHSVSGGRCEKIFAKEDALQGKWFNDFYNTGDLVPYIVALGGDHILGYINTGVPAISVDQFLASDGAGGLTPINNATGGLVMQNIVVPADTITNLAVETAFKTILTVPANYLKVGDVINISAVMTATGVNSTNTFTRKLKQGINSNLTASSPATIEALAAVNPLVGDIAYFNAQITINAVGIDGSYDVNGTAGQGTGAAATVVPFTIDAAALNTTVVNYFGITDTQSAASPANVDTMTSFVAELVRSGFNVAVAMAEVAVNNSAGSAAVRIPCRIL